MIPNTYSSIENSSKDLVKDLSTLSLGKTNDNSNPQQGHAPKSNHTAEHKAHEDANPSVLTKQPANRIDPNKKEERKLFVGGLPGNGKYKSLEISDMHCERVLLFPRRPCSKSLVRFVSDFFFILRIRTQRHQILQTLFSLISCH